MILYLGNILSKQGLAPAMMELLSKKLSDKYKIKMLSGKRNRFVRFIDLVGGIVWNSASTTLVIIDTYSTGAFWFAFCASITCRVFHIPYITVLRGGDLPFRLSRSRWFSRMIFNNAALNVSPSRYLQIEFERYGYRTLVIPNFIEIGKYSQKSRVDFHPKLFWVRSFHKTYNPGLAVKILHRVKKRWPDATLSMVGPDKDGSIYDVMQLAKDLSVERAVQFPGRLSKDEWTRLSEQYDIFINTTDFDNMPVSVIEAMALGLPVISTNAGGLPLLLSNEKDGLLVERNDLDGFVNAVFRIVDNPELGKTLAENARIKAVGFSWEYVGPKWEEIIDKFQRQK